MKDLPRCHRFTCDCGTLGSRLEHNGSVTIDLLLQHNFTQTDYTNQMSALSSINVYATSVVQPINQARTNVLFHCTFKCTS